MAAVLKRQRNARDALLSVAEGLVKRVPALGTANTISIAKALHQLLNGPDELSRNMRIGMQHYLIEAAELQGSNSRQTPETMLTTEAAAELMQCSRPYVVMLIDNQKLAGAAVTDGGHRRVPESSVRAWIKEREALSKTPDHHAVAEENGMYATPEQAFIEANKRPR